MNDDDDDDGYDDDDEHEDECNCPSCQLNRHVKQIIKQNVAMGAANARRGFWTEVYVASIRSGGNSNTALVQANAAIHNLDKVFPEVRTAAMEEDR